MKIVGYYKTMGGKGYVAFQERNGGGIVLTDGFHDKRKRSIEYIQAYYNEVSSESVDVKKITERMKGTRPWHPLLRLLQKE